MSSIYRDVGEAHASVYRSIPENLDALSVEEMKSLLSGIREDACEAYCDYAVFMGWHDNRNEAISFLTPSQESEPPSPPLNRKMSLIVVSDWFSEQRGIPLEVITGVFSESNKAYLTDFNWIPKSQIVSKKEILWREDVPQECVPWFESNLAVGHQVRLVCNGELGGNFEVDGVVEQIIAPEIYVNGKSYLMGNIMQVIRFENEGDDNDAETINDSLSPTASSEKSKAE